MRALDLQVFDGKSYLQTALGKGIWPLMVVTSEIVQTGILADFCYYFVLSMAQGDFTSRFRCGDRLLLRLIEYPSLLLKHS